MPTNRQLKLDLLKEQHHYARHTAQILQALTRLDPGAALLPLEKAVASRSLVKKLWDMLPGEPEAYSFSTVEEQTLEATALLPATGEALPITLHLGWDVLAFTCSLQAAWQAWPQFASLLSTETYNCCLYPESLDWYVVRAGSNLYPMSFTGERYELKKEETNG